jgi:IS5 family transposase
MPPSSSESVADKGYDGARRRERLEAAGSTPIIPPRGNHQVQDAYAKNVHRSRNTIQRVVRRAKDRCRIATSFDPSITNLMAVVALAAAVIWWL